MHFLIGEITVFIILKCIHVYIKLDCRMDSQSANLQTIRGNVPPILPKPLPFILKSLCLSILSARVIDATALALFKKSHRVFSLMKTNDDYSK